MFRYESTWRQEVNTTAFVRGFSGLPHRLVVRTGLIGVDGSLWHPLGNLGSANDFSPVVEDFDKMIIIAFILILVRGEGLELMSFDTLQLARES